MKYNYLILLLCPLNEGFNFQPSKISLKSVSQSYEDTWIRKLFSSVPRRKYAIKDVSLNVKSGDFLVILGISSSGKSTILRLVDGKEQPVGGEVVVDSTSKPIYLDSKPEFNDVNTVHNICLSLCDDKNVGSELIIFLSDLIDLDVSKKPSDLAISDTLKYGLMKACIESIDLKEPHSPILLLDEWMDTETPNIVEKVEEAIFLLADEASAIILCITHKPNNFSKPYNWITMCRGEILHR